MKNRLTILMTMVSLISWSAVGALNPEVVDVDVDIDGIADPAHTCTAEVDPGGFVCVGGPRKKITLTSSVGSTASDPEVRLSWVTGKIKLENPDGSAVTPDSPAGANPAYKDYAANVPPFDLYVTGIVVSASCGDEAISLEGLHSSPSGTPYALSDTVRFTVLKVDLDVGNGSGGGPDGDTDDPEDGTHGYIPGDRGNTHILSWSSGTLSPQKLKIVALAPSIHHVRFQIVSCSAIAGFCANTHMPDTTSYDYGFEPTTDEPLASFVQDVVVGGKAVADLYCKDFGGKCRVAVTFRDAARNVLHTCWLDIPRDADSDGISDQWEENAVTEWNAQYGESQTVGNGFFAASDDKEEKDPDGSGSLAAHATVGDSLTVMQEYRGFMFDGPSDWGGTVGYKRLSPARKNLLIEVEDMGGFTASATKAEVVSAMATLKAVYSSSTGAEVDYATDNNNAPYANFNSQSAITTYRTAHRGHDAGTFDYSEYLYLLFCEKDWAANTYGKGADGWLGGNVYCVLNRTRASTLSSLGLGITFAGCIGFTATHEIGHCLKAEHYLPILPALQVKFSPLAASEIVKISRVNNDLKLDTAPGSDTVHTISLLASTADTFTELEGQVDALPNYSASVLGSSGTKYSYTIYGFAWQADSTADALIQRHYDHSVMESPAFLLDQLLSPTLANTGPGYTHEVQRLDFANKE